MNIWLIRHSRDRDEFWDGELQRWDMLSLTTQAFTDEEKAQYELPPAGEWIRDN